MPEMLPVPLVLDRYNPAFGDERGNIPNDGQGEYLDPDKDYEAVAELRAGLLRQDNEDEDWNQKRKFFYMC